jgi:Ala-tRNA(Pro) deacylase
MQKHVDQVVRYLQGQGVSFQLGHHKEAYTAMEIAAAQHVPGRQMAKSVIIKSGGDYIMCVLPSTHLIDFERVKEVTGLSNITLASEEEVGELFPESEIGAEPPFGQLAGMQVLCDQSLAEDRQIVFNAGTHTETIKMKFNDYERLVHPNMARIGIHV